MPLSATTRKAFAGRRPRLPAWFGPVVAAALIVEVSYQPPFWLHAVLWIPLILALSLGLLRPLKALFYAINYSRRPDGQ